MLRLQKFLAQAGLASRRSCEQLIKENKIFVNGQIAALGTKVSDADEVFFDGQKVVLNYAGHLKYLINEYLEEGDMCQIFYAGTEILQRGAFAGKETHKFELALAKKATCIEKKEEPAVEEEAEESIDFDEFAGL